jgi:anti-anti-sigma factor
MKFCVADTLLRPNEIPVEDMAALSVEFVLERGTCRLMLTGALEAHSVCALAAQFDRLGCSSFASVLVDLSQLGTLDHVGANALLGLHHYVAARGAEMSVCGASDAVWRVLNSPELHTIGATHPHSQEVGP